MENILERDDRDQQEQEHHADAVDPRLIFGVELFARDALDERREQQADDAAAVQRRDGQQVHYTEVDGDEGEVIQHDSQPLPGALLLVGRLRDLLDDADRSAHILQARAARKQVPEAESHDADKVDAAVPREAERPAERFFLHVDREAVELLAAEVAGYLWQKGWAERNGGNITVNVTAYADDEIRSMAPISDPVPFGMTLPHLKGCYFFCKGTNRRMRDLARRPMENGSVIRILDDCASYEIVADNPVKPTSELASHLAMHDQMIASGNGYTAAVHTHPIDLVAMTHNPAFLAKDVLTNLLWSMIPETRAFCPKGLGIVPYKMPSSTELAEATIEQLREYDVVMWEKHGVCAVGPDIMEAFDQIDVLSKSAQIYLTAKSMGFEPTGTTQEQMDELKRAFNL